MEPATQKKKAVGLKGKLRKTIKNVLCRPDPALWPVLSEENENSLRMALDKYKVEIPVFTKPHWKEIKHIPKEDRPKQPKMPKQEGLIFGVAQCHEAIKNKDCSAVILESEVKPRLIVEPIIEACSSTDIPIVCLKHLQALCHSNFGIKTLCLAVRRNCLEELSGRIMELAKSFKPIKRKEAVDEMEVETEANIPIPSKSTIDKDTEVTNLLLLRKNKKTRVFVPPSDNADIEVNNPPFLRQSGKKQFIGQDFVEFSHKTTKLDQDNATFKKMIVKRIANNPNRAKAGKKRKN